MIAGGRGAGHVDGAVAAPDDGHRAGARTGAMTGGHHDGEVMGDGGSALGTVRSTARRARPLIVGAVVLLMIVVINLIPGPAEDDRALSPGNAAPAGARAVAEVLRDQGVEVVRPGSYEEAVAALGEGTATLFLNDAQQYLTAGQVAGLTELAHRSVLAAPSARQLGALDDDFSAVGPAPFDLGGDAPALAADCTDDSATAAGTLSPTGTVYSGPVECFPTTLEGPDGSATGGLYVTGTDGSVAVLGAPSILSNGSITQEGHAALALRSLGSAPTLVWYEPTGADVVSSGEGVDPTTLLPPWVDPLLIWLLVCTVLAMFWRGRRLGPLATEPLPVVVRAAETAEGRARLYQDSRSIAHAAANLRAATLSRMARRLRVDRSASPMDVVEAAARHSGRPVLDVQRRLLDHTPTTNHDLVLWAQEILDLEKEITPS